MSITPFIPKPHTPFQWASLMEREEADRRLDYLKKKLRMPGIQVKWQHPDMSFLEGILSRGDRRVAQAIESAFEKGCRFDGWTDQFDVEKWNDAFNECGVDTGFFTTRQRKLDETLPWDHMDAGISRDFLKTQWADAQKCLKVEDCRYGKCHLCGVCDHKILKPVVFNECPEWQKEETGEGEEKDTDFNWIEITYEKKGQARFFGHLEQANLFSRSLRRTGARMKYSKGYHPMPRISFDDPLPLGMESDAEKFRVLIHKDTDCDDVAATMNASLPEGLHITKWKYWQRRGKEKNETIEAFIIENPETPFDAGLLEAFLQSERWDHDIRSKKGKVHAIDLKKAVVSIEMEETGTIRLSTTTCDGKCIRPAVIIAIIFGLNEKQTRRLLIRKLEMGSPNVQ